MTSQEIVERGEATGLAEIKPTPELVAQVYAALIDDEIPPEVGDPAVTAKAIQRRIAAGTFDDSMEWSDQLEALGELATKTTAIGGKPVKVSPTLVFHGFHLNPSTFPNPETGKKGAYAVVDATNTETGERDVYSAGSGNVKVQLAKAWEEGRFPFEGVIVVQPSQNGSVHWLKFGVPEEAETA